MMGAGGPDLVGGKRPVVLYDGLCAFCDAYVRFVMRWDRDSKFLFAPLEGTFGLRLKSAHPELPEDLDSVILWEPGELGSGRLMWYSAAVLRTMALLGLPWSLLGGLRVVPRPLRDGVYRLIASTRYRWFGRLDSCRVPTLEERGRFLD